MGGCECASGHRREAVVAPALRQDETVLDLSAGTGAVVLDGGLSTALEEQGATLIGALWTARLLAEEPQRLVEAHRAYFRAGAMVATTASYQASVEGLVAAGYEAAEARRLITLSVSLAQQARDELADRQPGLLVAASAASYPAATRPSTLA